VRFVQLGQHHHLRADIAQLLVLVPHHSISPLVRDRLRMLLLRLYLVLLRLSLLHLVHLLHLLFTLLVNVYILQLQLLIFVSLYVTSAVLRHCL